MSILKYKYFIYATSLKTKILYICGLKTADNVFTFKFENRSIYSNIEANNTKSELLDVHFDVLCINKTETTHAKYDVLLRKF